MELQEHQDLVKNQVQMELQVQSATFRNSWYFGASKSSRYCRYFRVQVLQMVQQVLQVQVLNGFKGTAGTSGSSKNQVQMELQVKCYFRYCRYFGWQVLPKWYRLRLHQVQVLRRVLQEHQDLVSGSNGTSGAVLHQVQQVLQVQVNLQEQQELQEQATHQVQQVLQEQVIQVVLQDLVEQVELEVQVEFLGKSGTAGTSRVMMELQVQVPGTAGTSGVDGAQELGVVALLEIFISRWGGRFSK